MSQDEQQFVVMEQGVYGALDVKDPSKKRVAESDAQDLDHQIKQAIQENAQTYIK